MKLHEITGRKTRRGALGLVSQEQYEAHKEAKILKHKWQFHGTVRPTGKTEQLVIQMCSVCRKTQEINEKGRVVRR